jgi:glutamine synthetase
MTLDIDPSIQTIRVAWCDLHGQIRSKSMPAGLIQQGFQQGLQGISIGMVGTLMLKDTSDHTAFKVFEPSQFNQLGEAAKFANASNLLLKPNLNDNALRLHPLPWSPREAWLFAEPFFSDGMPVKLDARRTLQTAIAKLQTAGYAMRCGLEIEFHIYKIEDQTEALDPETAAWPGLAPSVSLLHQGYQLLSDAYTDRCHTPMEIVRQTALGLGLPLTSLEIEFGPSQFEAVFDVTDALTAADQMVLFTNGVRQALRRAGYHATFMCRPPFPNIMSSGWHLHQSLVDISTDAPVLPSSGIGQNYLAGLIQHGLAMTAFAAPSVSSYARYQPNVLAPHTVSWGDDSRAAMLRVLPNRIENRVGEPMANPYLYIASQIYAGLHGLGANLAVPCENDPAAKPLPESLGKALDALELDDVYLEGFGKDFINYYCHIKRFEIIRFEAADDKLAWLTSEYFNRF